MDDPKRGHGNQWPKFTISGKPYLRPCSTLALADGDFVVLDRFPTEDEAELLAPYIGQAVALNIEPQPEETVQPPVGLRPFAEDFPNEDDRQ